MLLDEDPAAVRLVPLLNNGRTTQTLLTLLDEAHSPYHWQFQHLPGQECHRPHQ